MRSLQTCLLLFPILAVACGDSGVDPVGGSGPEAGGADPAGGGADPAGAGNAGGEGGVGDGGGVVAGVEPALPQPTGACPDLVDGDVTFAPAGMPPRQVKLALGDGAGASSSLIIYWHATGSAPVEAAYSLGATLSDLTAAGGIVATPYSDPAAGQFEWFIVGQSSKQDDFLLADEIVGCLAEAEMLDPRHVHSMGMSAGALQTTAFSFARAAYVASVSTYSGGLPTGFGAANANPANKFAALIFHGGASDSVFGVDFQGASESYYSTLSDDGHFAAICDHGQGHDIPLDAAPSVAAFFAANPYGAWPSPYESAGLPRSFPAYCIR